MPLEFYIFLLSLPILFAMRKLLPPLPADTDQPLSTDKMRYPALGIALISLLLLTTINVPVDTMTDLHRFIGMDVSPQWVQMGLLGIAIVALVHGFGGRMLPRRFRWQRHHTVLLLIVLLAGIVRGWDINDTYRLFIDEALFMGDTALILSEPLPALVPNYAPATDAYSILQAMSATLFGRSMASLRLVSALMGMAGIVVVYTLARQLFSVRVALISALLLATFPVSVQFGRIGLYNVADSVFGLLAFVYILRGLRSGHVSDFAMAGVLFGITQYLYEGGRLFFSLFFVCWMVWIHVVARRDPNFRIPSRQQWGAFLFCFIVLAIPVYHTLWQFDYPITLRLNEVRINDNPFPEVDITHLSTPILQYVSYPSKGIFYQSEYAFILPILAPFFLLGFGRLLFEVHRLRGALLVWWIIGVSVSNSLISGSIQADAARHMVVYSVLMIVTAVGIGTIWRLVTDKMPRFRRWINGFFIAYLILVTGVQIGHYVGDVVPNMYDLIYGVHHQTGRPQPAFDDMILRAVELPPNTAVIVISDWLLPDTHRLVAPLYFGRDEHEFTVTGRFADTLDATYFATLPRDVNFVFVFTRYHQDRVVAMIEQYFTITHITDSPYDIPETVEMVFFHAPLSHNPPADRPSFVPQGDN